MKIAIYTGEEILRTVSCQPQFVDAQLGEGESYIDITTPINITDATHWVDGGVLSEKLPFSISLDNATILIIVGTATFSNIPVGTRARFLDQDVIIDDGELEYSTNTPETVLFTFSHPRHLPTTMEVTSEIL